MSKEKTIGEEYRGLLKLKAEIQKQISDIAEKSCVFYGCHNVIPFTEIDPLMIQEENCYDWYDSWTNYYVPCNVPNICERCVTGGGWCNKKQKIDKDTLTKILEVHNMTYRDWVMNKKTKSISTSY